MIKPGQQFGLYVVKEVYKETEAQATCCAEDPFFDRDVTLNIYSEEKFLQQEQLEKLESWLEKLAVLDHPSIAPIYDSGREENYFYYTSTYFSSGNLEQRLARPLSEGEALKVAYELSSALDYAFGKNIGQRTLKAENIFFDENNRAVIVDLGVDFAITQLKTGEETEEQDDIGSCVPEALRSLGELFMRMLLGDVYDPEGRVEDQRAGIENSQVRRLIGRFLLPGEWRFASFAELLEELRNFDELEERVAAQEDFDPFEPLDIKAPSGQETSPEDQLTEKMVADVRRLVAEKNDLQQSLDKALYEKSLAQNKVADGEKQLVTVRRDVAKAKEEANVAWELVAGQKYERWRPVAWAVGGFLAGFLLSGSYGYYYSEQTRSELLAKLKANEELIKNAAWRAEQQVAKAEQQKTAEQVEPVEQAKVATVPQVMEGVVTEAEAEQEAKQAKAAADVPVVQIVPKKEEARQWWPAGSEFSAAAAIPIEQLKAALGFESKDDLSSVLKQEVVGIVQGWANSWANQNLNNYFSFYSENYRPELKRSQQQWREIRQERVSRPQWIEVNIEDIRVRQISDDRIQVKFKQSYRSDFYQDRILKSINLIKEDGQWRILMERSLGMLAETDDIVGG